jgi:hypothetical protein
MLNQIKQEAVLTAPHEYIRLFHKNKGIFNKYNNVSWHVFGIENTSHAGVIFLLVVIFLFIVLSEGLTQKTSNEISLKSKLSEWYSKICWEPIHTST